MNMKVLCAFGKYAYGDRARGISYEYANFLPAIEGLGCEIVFMDIWDKRQYSNFSNLNHSFISAVEKEKPDIIFCVLMGYELWLETLELVKKYHNAVLINWSTDDSWKYEQFSRFVSPAFDLYVTTYKSAIAKAQRDGFDNFVLSQWAANQEHLLEPKTANACKYKVTFIGAAYGNRRKWIVSLKKRGLEVDCFGYGWEHGVVSDEDLPRIINDSIICLNFGDSGIMFQGLLPYRSRQIKARIFEVLGYGGFLVTEAAAGLEEYYRNGEDLVVFNNIDELTEILKTYLGSYQERDRIAANGYLKTISSHTYRHRFKYILDTAERLLLEKKSKKLTVDSNYSNLQLSFEDAARKHTVGIFLKLFRVILLLPCIVIFGKEKGARAARRILYEICWRLSGGKTYTAQGLPGRLFYKES